MSDQKPWEQQFEKWWEEHGQYCRAGGGDYEKTFAYRAWEAALESLWTGIDSEGGTHD